MFRRILLVTALLIFFNELNYAAIPQTISYQGVLKNLGIAVEGPVSLRFALYTAESGGSAVWSETQDVVLVQGVFSVNLGSVTSIPTTLNYNTKLYLGITVLPGTIEMSQRVLINMVPYSQNANTANNAAHATNSDNAYAIQGYTVSATAPKAGDLLKFDGANWTPTKPEVAVCRWNVFDPYDNIGDACGNDPVLFAGITPSKWYFRAKAEEVSLNKDTLRAFFNRKCYAKKNALIYNENFISTSTGSRIRYIVVLFRIRNTTGNSINWNPYFYYTAGGINFLASLALNGVGIWNASTTGSITPTTTPAVTLSMLPHSISSIVVVSSSSSFHTASGSRTCRLAFYNNSLELPAGLEFVDDLDED